MALALQELMVVVLDSPSYNGGAGKASSIIGSSVTRGGGGVAQWLVLVDIVDLAVLEIRI